MQLKATQKSRHWAIPTSNGANSCQYRNRRLDRNDRINTSVPTKIRPVRDTSFHQNGKQLNNSPGLESKCSYLHYQRRHGNCNIPDTDTRPSKPRDNRCHIEQLTLVSSYPEEADNVINQLFQTPGTENDRRWYPTPEICDDPSTLNPIERRIYDEILRLRELEKLDPTLDDDQRRAFLEQFNWDDSQLTKEEQAMVERLLVKYHQIFARHRFIDIGINTEV